MNKPVDVPLSSAALAQWQHEYTQQIGQDRAVHNRSGPGHQAAVHGGRLETPPGR
jgi:hypothetical protein